MAEQPEELKKLVSIATDVVIPSKVRKNTIKFIGHMASREAFLALLDLAANERLTRGERELALKHAREIIRAGR